MSDLKLSSYIQPSLNTESILPWTISTLYQTDQFVYFGDTLCKCKSSHTSSSTNFITDYQDGKWVNINPIPLTSVQRLAIMSPIDGCVVYDTTLKSNMQYINNVWAMFNSLGSFNRVELTSDLSAPSATTKDVLIVTLTTPSYGNKWRAQVDWSMLCLINSSNPSTLSGGVSDGTNYIASAQSAGSSGWTTGINASGLSQTEYNANQTITFKLRVEGSTSLTVKATDRANWGIKTFLQVAFIQVQ